MKALLWIAGAVIAGRYLWKHAGRTDAQQYEARVLAEAKERMASTTKTNKARDALAFEWSHTYAEQEGLHNPFAVHRPEAPFYAGRANGGTTRLPV